MGATLLLASAALLLFPSETQDPELEKLKRELEEANRKLKALEARAEVNRRKFTGVRFEVETAGDALLPLQPLLVNFHLVNAGTEPLSLRTELDPNLYDVSVLVRKPGGRKYEDLTIWPMPRCVVRMIRPLSLRPGQKLSLQTELPIQIWSYLMTRKLRTGVYRYRFRLEIRELGIRYLVSKDVPLKIAEPTGEDRELLARILEQQLWGCLQGTQVHEWLWTARKLPWDTLERDLRFVQGLTESYPRSPYTTHLRRAFVTACEAHAFTLAETEPERKILAIRMRRVAAEALAAEEPPSWKTAEMLLLLSRDRHFPVSADQKTKYLKIYQELCPTDTRVPKLRKNIESTRMWESLRRR